MAQPKKITTKRKKFIDVEIPLIKTKIELVGNSIAGLENRTVKLDLTRQLRGKSVEAVLKIKEINNKAVAEPKKITLMPYFIRRMMRKRISYVEDSFNALTQESLVKVKPFIITRKKVSRVVRKTLRNLAKNWLEDYLAERTDNEIFSEILSNQLQKPLSLKLKKTYPLSLCEIRVLEVLRPLNNEEIPKLKKKEKITEISRGIDQLKEIEEEIKQAEKEIEKTQKKASELEKTQKKASELEKTQKKASELEKTPEKKSRKQVEKKSEKTGKSEKTAN